MKLAYGIAATLAVGLLLVGCSPTEQPSPSDQPGHTGAPGTVGLPQASDTPVVNGDLSGWVGEYAFAEVVADVGSPPGSVIAYGISIYRMGDDYFAAISISGYGSTQTMTASVRGDANSIALVFSAYMGPNPWTAAPSYQLGDTLLQLARQNDGVVTTWGLVQPQVSSNTAPGFYFALSTPSPSPS